MLHPVFVLSPAPLPRNLEAAFRDLGSERAATRASAVRDVVRHGQSGDEVRGRAIAALEKVLRADPVAAVRAEAATAMADLGAADALPTLLVAVEDDDPHVRQMAISALGEIGDPRAARRIERALSDRRPEVRYQAVIAYARIAGDDPAAVATALVAATGDADDAIRYIAMRVAEEQLSARGNEASDERMTRRARELLDAEEGGAAGDGGVGVVAALYLARLGDPAGLARVLEVVSETREPPPLEDEQACVELCGELRVREAIPHLERRAWGRRRILRTVFAWGAGDGSSCAFHARIALARLGHERARAEILADLSSWRRETREAAVVAAGRARLGEARPVLQGLQERGGSVDAALVREALVRLAVD